MKPVNREMPRRPVAALKLSAWPAFAADSWVVIISIYQIRSVE